MSRLEAALAITTVAVSVVGCSAAEVATVENNRIVTTASEAIAECASKSTDDLVFTIPTLDMWIKGYQSRQLTFNTSGNETILEEFALVPEELAIALITISNPNTPDESYTVRYLSDEEVNTYKAGFRCAGLPRPNGSGDSTHSQSEIFVNADGTIVTVRFPIQNAYSNPQSFQRQQTMEA